MTDPTHDPNAGVPVPIELVESVQQYIKAQLAHTWSVRPDGEGEEGAALGAAPFPTTDNPMMEYLIFCAVHPPEGADLRAIVVQLAVHAWMEGHVEGYDHAMERMAGVLGKS